MQIPPVDSALLIIFSLKDDNYKRCIILRLRRFRITRKEEHCPGKFMFRLLNVDFNILLCEAFEKKQTTLYFTYRY